MQSNVGSGGGAPPLQKVQLVRAGERTQHTAQTPGMLREEAIATPGMWAGYVRTAPGMVSGWHHHGEYETTIFVVSGHLRMESGPGGQDVSEAGPGDFIYVPRAAIHREANPGEVESELVVVRAGTGSAVTNVGGPAPLD